MNTPISVLAVATAKPGQEDALRVAQEKLVVETRKEPGCLLYELHQSLEDSRMMIFICKWESEEAWQEHLKGNAIAGFHASGAFELVEGFTLHRMQAIAA